MTYPAAWNAYDQSGAAKKEKSETCPAPKRQPLFAGIPICTAENFPALDPLHLSEFDFYLSIETGYPMVKSAEIEKRRDIARLFSKNTRKAVFSFVGAFGKENGAPFRH